MPIPSCSHTNFENGSFPNAKFPMPNIVPSASTIYLHCTATTSSNFIHATTCRNWLLHTCRVIHSSEHALGTFVGLSILSITPATPRRWILAWLVLDNPCQAQFRLEIVTSPAWACCARHNENTIAMVLMYNLVRSLTHLRRRL